MKRGLLAMALLGLLGLVAGCVDREAQQQNRRTQELLEDETVPVVVETAQISDISSELVITGSIEASDTVSVGASVNGRITQVFVEEGDQVSAGQPIARQEVETLQAQVQQARAQVDSARAQLAQARTSATVNPQISQAGVQQAKAQVENAQAGLAQAEANLRKLREGAREQEVIQARASVNAAQSALETARQNLERQAALFAEGAVAEAQLDAAENQFENAQAQYTQAVAALDLALEGARAEDIEAAEQAVRSARQQVQVAQEQVRIAESQKLLDTTLQDQVNAAQAQVRSAQQGLNQAQKALQDATIRAPFSGTVSSQPLKAGTFAGAGTPIVQLVGANQTFFVAEVPESSINQVEVGDEVNVIVDALSDQVFPGTVQSINNFGSNVARLFRVRVSIDIPAPDLKPNMFARGILQTSVVQDAVVVEPYSIVTQNDKSYVFVVEDENAVRVGVTLGAREEGRVEVLGLRAGSQVIIKGQTEVTDGSPVLVRTLEEYESEIEEDAGALEDEPVEQETS